MKKTNRTIRATRLILLLGILTGEASAQAYPDAGMWNTFNAEWGLHHNLDLVFTEEFRLKENFSQVNLFYTNAGLEYKAVHWLKLGLIYRNIQKMDPERGISFRNRIMFDINLHKDLKKATLAFRTRFQGEVKDWASSKNGKIPEYYMRNKLSLKYDLAEKWSPYVSVEFRYQIYERGSPETNGLFHRARPCMGFEYKINKSSSLGLYYLAQYEWNVREPETLYIAGLEYDLSI